MELLVPKAEARMARVLVVDDEPAIAWAWTKLAQGLGHQVSKAASAEQALELAERERPDLVLLDVRLPGMDGLTALPRLKALLGDVPIVIMTAYGDLSTAVEAVRQGARDYLVKPFDLQVAERVLRQSLERLAPPLEQAVALGDARSKGSDGTGDEPFQLVGRSPAIQEVFKRIALVAPSLACVHLRGESGTGKELVARALHRYSRRSQGPFVAVNVAALSPHLAESELFGHVRGAFTGADQPRKGLLEQAHEGTIFLDEVADIPLTLQVKLLRALEHGEVLPVGSNRPVQSDFRVLSATHQDLQQLVATGRFRHDLYFRLCTFQIDLPPLRKRPEDIEDLAGHFLRTFARRSDGPAPTLGPATLQELRRRPWYGNVRELRNVMEHGVILARGGVVLPEHLPPPVAPSGPSSELTVSSLAVSSAGTASLVEALRRWAEEQLQLGPTDDLYQRLLNLVEPPVLEAALKRHHGQVAAAARSLGLHRMTLRKKMNQFGLGGDNS